MTLESVGLGQRLQSARRTEHFAENDGLANAIARAEEFA
jgi:hypothetical protein